MGFFSRIFHRRKKTVSKPSPSVSKPSSKSSIGGGTYYKGSGTYVSPSGQGFSMANAPKGATTSFSRNPQLRRPGGGGGGGSSGGGGGGGTYYKGSGTYVSPSGQGFSMANAPKGATVTSRRNPQLHGKQPTLVSKEEQLVAKGKVQQQQSQQAPEFTYSGKVEESFKGKSQQTKYYIKGKQTGRIYTTPSGETYAETKTPSRFTFKKGRTTRKVIFKRGETPAEILDTTQAIMPSLQTQDIGTVIDIRDTGLMENLNVHKQFSGGTTSAPNYNQKQFQVYSPGTIYEVPTETIQRKGKTIPITKIYTIEKNWGSKPAAKGEIKTLKDYQIATGYKNVALSKPPTKLKRTTSELKGKYREFASEPWGFGAIGEERTKKFFSKGGKVGSKIGSVITGLTPRTKGGAIKTGIIYGATLGVGFAIKGVTSGVTWGATKLFGATAGSIAGASVKGGVFAVGTALTGRYALQTTKEFQSARTTWEKGQVIGKTIREVGVGAIGFRTGSKGFDILQGLYRTKGISFLSTKQGVYPSANPSKHLELFQKNVIEGLSYKKYTPSQKMKLASEYAKFNLKQQLTFKRKSIYPSQHAYPHMKEVGVNIQKIIKVYPEYKPYLIREYGSLKGARTELTKSMWHDLLKVGSSSKNEFFGKGHGKVFYDLWKSKKLPKDLLNIKPKVAEAIKYHEVTSMKNPTVEWKILSTADRLQFSRFKGGVDVSKLPLPNAINRIVKLKKFNFYEPKISSGYKGDFLGKYKISNGKIYPIGTKPGAFHTTSQKFWGKTLTPKSGTSEFEYLYASTKVSTPFANLPGSSKPKLFPSIKDILSPPTKPSIVFLKPKGFRKVNVGWSKSPVFEGQRYVKGKGYAFIKQEPKAGYADVPGMKKEIESLFRGTYFLEPRKYYTKINNVRVPIDVAKYLKSGKGGGKGGGKVTGKGSSGKITGKTIYNPSSYSPYNPPPIVDLSVGVVSYSRTTYLKPPISYSNNLVSSKNISKSYIKSFPKSGYSGGSGGSGKGVRNIKRTSVRPPRSVYRGFSSPFFKPYSYSPLYKPKKSEEILYSYKPKKKKKGYILPNILPIQKQPKQSKKLPVLVRRRGKFRIVGYGKNPLQAMNIGKRAVRGTLAATFKVPGLKVTKIPGFKTKQTKQGTLFIEPIGKRLKRGTFEIPEIMKYKRIKSVGKKVVRKKKKKLKGGKK